MMGPKVVQDTQRLLLEAINRLTITALQLHHHQNQNFLPLALEKLAEASELIRDGIATFDDHAAAIPGTAPLSNHSQESQDGTSTASSGSEINEQMRVSGLTRIEVPPIESTSERQETVSASSNQSEIPKQSAASARQVYQEDGSLNDGNIQEQHTHIILLALDEDPNYPVVSQELMKGKYLKTAWSQLVGNCPVILRFLNESFYPTKDAQNTAAYDSYISNVKKSSYRGVGIHVPRFMASEFVKSQNTYHLVKDLNEYEAWRAIKNVGFGLKEFKNRKSLSVVVKNEMVRMAKFLGMSEPAIEKVLQCDGQEDTESTTFISEIQGQKQEFESNDDFVPCGGEPSTKKRKL